MDRPQRLLLVSVGTTFRTDTPPLLAPERATAPLGRFAKRTLTFPKFQLDPCSQTPLPFSPLSRSNPAPSRRPLLPAPPPAHHSPLELPPLLPLMLPPPPLPDLRRDPFLLCRHCPARCRGLRDPGWESGQWPRFPEGGLSRRLSTSWVSSPFDSSAGTSTPRIPRRPPQSLGAGGQLRRR
jgi:hypothetical protein